MTQEERINELERLVVSLSNRIESIEKSVSMLDRIIAHDKINEINNKIDALCRKIDTKKPKTFFRHTM